MSSYSKIILVGRLGADVELRYTEQGVPVATFSLAVDDGYGDNKQTQWYRVTVWRKTAESAAQYLSKGKEVLAEGHMQADKDTGGPRIWTDKQGAARASFEMTADRIVFLGGRSESASKSADTGPAGTSDGYGDDIPF